MFRKKDWKWLYPELSFADNDEGGSDDTDETVDENVEEENSTEEEVVDYDAEIKKRGSENVLKELKKRQKREKELQAQIDALKEAIGKPDDKKEPTKQSLPKEVVGKLPPHLVKRINKWTKEQAEDRRVDPEFMNDIAEMMVETAVGAIKWHSEDNEGFIAKKYSSLNKVQKKYQSDMLKENISEMGKKDEYKTIVKNYSSEIEKLMKSEFAPDYWDAENVLESVIGRVIAKHAAEISGKTKEEPKKIKEKINETVPSGAGKSVGVTDSELKDYADEHNIDLTNAKARESAIKGVQAKKKAMKRID